MKNFLKYNKGITLVALVVTIIVLLILAGITINMLMGDNGIISQAQEAKRANEIAEIKGNIKLDITETELDNLATQITKSQLEEILNKYGTINYKEDGTTIKSLTTTQGDHEIPIEELYNGTFLAGGDDDNKNPTVANAPDLSGFNESSTYYVSWDLTSSPYQINDTTLISGVAPSGWCDYTAGVNHWANIKTTGGGNDCYWVWIPRYAYCITDGYHSDTAGTIDIKFLQGTTNTPIDGSSITISNSSGAGNWNVHPAFWWDENNNGVEDDGEQLTGIWVAKFEASSSNVSVETVENDLTTEGGGDTNSLQVRVIPNVTSWRGITVNNIFTVCRNLTNAENSLENTSNLNSHMMKNVEWGAVAYLSRSVYGMNGEVWNNPYYNNTTNYSTITGLCGNETNGKDNDTTNISNTVKYNETGGGNASTTGNVYGVYDMAGGAWENVAGIYIGTSSDNLGSNTDRNNLWDSNNSKYVDKYTNTTGSQPNYNGNTDNYGDAVYETSSSGIGDSSSWGSSYSFFPSYGLPLFNRGGHAMHASSSGVFAFVHVAGATNSLNSFRPVVLSGQP